MRDESKASFEIVRHNLRTGETWSVVEVVKARGHAENAVDRHDRHLTPEAKDAGWSPFLQETKTRAGTDPKLATELAQQRAARLKAGHRNSGVCVASFSNAGGTSSFLAGRSRYFDHFLTVW